MAKAVFTSKVGSIYDDNVESRYHFPRTYLNFVQESVGDLVVYYQPRRGGNMSYFAVAEVKGIRPDPENDNLFYADIGNYIDFEREVPFSESGHFYESALQKSDGSSNRGAFGRSVRIIEDREFDAIVAAGFAVAPSWPDAFAAEQIAGFAELEQAPFGTQREMQVLSRPFRDRAFTRNVQRAYDRRCAVTGLRILNGGGRPEVQAAHIWSVANGGPDSVRNGLALSSTMHWMFDRGLISFSEQYDIDVAAEKVPEEVRRLINPTGKLIVPEDISLRPSPNFLRMHNSVKAGA